MDPTCTISEAARLLGVSSSTLRYYENAGLIPGVVRDIGGRRIFVSADLEAARVVRSLRMSGMKTREIRRYMHLLGQGADTGEERLAMLRDHERSVVTRIAELERLLGPIREKLASYEARGCKARRPERAGNGGSKR
jgi:DNA-binding transcriptional MerR regulator